MSIRYVVACLAMLGGCTTAKNIYLPDGSRGHYINCDGLMSSSADCLQKAGDICGSKGYSVVNPGGMGGMRDLFVKCKE